MIPFVITFQNFFNNFSLHNETIVASISRLMGLFYKSKSTSTTNAIVLKVYILNPTFSRTAENGASLI
jgi:hypothetical protein